MTLTDGRRKRHDYGPCHASTGRRDVALTVVAEDAPMARLCPICASAVAPGRVTCSPACHRLYMGRRSV